MLTIDNAAARVDSLPRGMQNGNGNTWSAQQSPFGGPPMSGPSLWSNGSGKENIFPPSDLFLFCLLIGQQALVDQTMAAPLDLSVAPIAPFHLEP